MRNAQKPRIGLLFLSLLLSLTLLSGCGSLTPQTDGASGKLQVVATDFPAFDFARQVCGDGAEVSMLLPPGAESHSYEPTPADILSVQNCDLFIYAGGESDTWVDTILESIDGQVNALRMVDCVPLLEEETLQGMTAHEEPEAGESVEYDEHVWTSPVNAELIVKRIGGELVSLDPDNAEIYAANETNYLTQLQTLDQNFRDFFSTVTNKTLVFGDRFPLRYFAEEYDLTCYAAFPGCSTQTEPSAATIAFLTDKVKEEHLTTVYYIEFSNHLVADSIAEATGTQTALFHSCHNVSQADLDRGATYVSIMEENLQTLQRTMPQKKAAR